MAQHALESVDVDEFHLGHLGSGLQPTSDVVR